MAKFLKAAGIIIGSLLLLGIAYLFISDFSAYKPRVESMVSEATGREFRIQGDFEVSVLPRPTVRMEGLTLANAPWAAEPNMLEVGQVSVKVGLWSLLFRPVVVHDFQLHDASMLAETNTEGDLNWSLGTGMEEPEPGEEDDSRSAEPLVDLRAVNISNVTLTYRKPDADDFTAAIDALTLIEVDSGDALVEGRGQMGDLPASMTGRVDGPDVELEATLGDIRFRSTTHHENGALDIDLELGTLDAVGKLLDIENLPIEDLTVTGNIDARGDKLVLTNVVAGLGAASLTIDGELDGSTQAADFSLVAEANDLRVLMPDAPPVPFAATAQLAMEDGVLRLDPFEMTHGVSDLSGSLEYVSGDTTTINLVARSTLIDRTQGDPEESEDAAAEETEAAGDEEESPYVFGEDPLPLDMLNSLNADIDVTVDELRMSTGRLLNFRVVATAADGNLELDNAFDGGVGGTFENSVELATTETSADLVLKTVARELKVGLLSGDDVPEDLLPESRVDVNITGSGASLRELAASTNGQVVFTQGPGRIKNDLVGKLSGDLVAQLFGALNPLAEEEEYSNWECTIFSLDFESGVGEIDGFLMQEERLMIVGGGEIDLNTEELRIEFNTKPREGVGLSADMFVTPFVALKGTLADPRVGLNAKGAILTGGAAFLTGGMSFLYQGVVDRATAGKGRCTETLAAIVEE